MSEGGTKSARPDHPARIGKYAIVGPLGHGAMGQVFRALDPVLNRHVAIKVMVADVSADALLSQRFLREAQSAAQLNHPNIVTLHDFGDDNGQLFMAMELLEGMDLSKVLKQGRLETLEDRLALMEQTCDGMAFAHSMKLVHRDLKPANIHVHVSGRVKVMDFGLARVQGSDMTRAGTIMGSPNYMSPEQVRGERADARSDVFAMGAVFYEVLSGRRAFDADSVPAILYKVAHTEPQPLRHIAPDLPNMLVELVEKALRKPPVERFSDAVEMREALDVCRRVLDGSLDEATGLASLREARTLIQPGAPGPVEALADSDTLSAAADTRPVLPRRGAAGSRAVRLGKTGPTAVMPGRSTLAESTPPEPPVSAPAAASRAGLYAGLGVLGAALIAAAFVALRPAPPPALPTPDPKSAALVSVAVETQLEIARRNLALRDLSGAIAAAERALRLDPENVEARTLLARAQASLDVVEATVRQARAAAQAGDTQAASQAVARVLAQVPGHPIAAELAPFLNSRQGRAEESPRPAKPRPAASTAAAAATPLATPPPPVAPVTTPAAAPSAAPPVVTALPTTLPPAPVAAPALPAGPSDEVLARRLLDDFERAIETKDVALYKSLRSSLSADEERKLRAAFDSVRSQEVDLAIESFRLEAGGAVVRVRRSGRINGQPLPPIQQVLRLVKGPSGWLIREIQ